MGRRYMLHACYMLRPKSRYMLHATCRQGVKIVFGTSKPTQIENGLLAFFTKIDNDPAHGNSKTRSMAEPSADLIAWLAAANEALVVYAKVFASEGYENFGMLRGIKEDERDDILEALDAAGIKKVRSDRGVWRAPVCVRVFCRPVPISLFYGCARSFRRRPAAGAQRAMRRITCTNTCSPFTPTHPGHTHILPTLPASSPKDGRCVRRAPQRRGRWRRRRGRGARPGGRGWSPVRQRQRVWLRSASSPGSGAGGRRRRRRRRRWGRKRVDLPVRPE